MKLPPLVVVIEKNPVDTGICGIVDIPNKLVGTSKFKGREMLKKLKQKLDVNRHSCTC